MIKLSIIVPIYGVEQYLHKCVASLLAQDIPSSEYEIILVDDGSPDACPQICDEYAAAHKNIRVVHRENGGLSAARNTGIEVAQGKYIMFVDSDDFIEPNVLKGLLKQVERDNLDVLRYRLQYVNPQYKVYNPYKSDPFKGNDYSEVPTDGVSFLNSRMSTGCYAWAFVLRRELLKGCIFTPVIYFEDTDWTPRMLYKANRVASTNTVVYNYLQREGSITNAVNKSKQKKVLDDKMRLVEILQRQSQTLQEQGKDASWFKRMIADTIISIITIIAVQFYGERDSYLKCLKDLDVYPIQSRNFKTRMINFSPQLVVELLYAKKRRLVHRYIIALYRKCKYLYKYFISPKEYYKHIQICGKHAGYPARLIADRLGIGCPKGKVVCFNTYSIPAVLHYHRAPIKLFFTQENTHVVESYWQQFENIWLKEPSLSLTLGFDYAEHPKYLRFPFWLEHLFAPDVTKEQLEQFVGKFNLSEDNASRTKDCAFVCKKDYFGDRAQMADLVAQVMPMSYPSDFRHNDDDMRGKFNDDKIAYLRQFKFNLCPENSNNKGYVTEKIFEAIKAGCVPIYWGNEGYPEPDILNPKAIVYLDKDKPEEGLALLRKLYENPKAYEEFASQPRFLPGAADKIYAYYERLEGKLREIL